MTGKQLGQIKNVYFGYSDFLFGLIMELGGPGWGVVTTYDYNPTYKDEARRNECAIKMLSEVQDFMKSAKVKTVHDLKGKPVECTFEGSLLKDFRILTEVI